MRSQMDEEFLLFGEDTMRQLETLASAPNEQMFKLKQVEVIKNLRRSMVMIRRAQHREYQDLKKLIVGPMKMAEMVRTEISANKDLAQMRKDTGRLWKAAIWLLGTGIVTGLGGMITLAAMMGRLLKVLPK